MTPHEKRKFWGDHIAALKASGQSQADYCRTAGVKKSALSYWHRRLITAAKDAGVFVPIAEGRRLPLIELQLRENLELTLHMQLSFAALWRMLGLG